MQYTFHVDWYSTEVTVEADSYDEALSKADVEVKNDHARYFDGNFVLNDKEVSDV